MHKLAPLLLLLLSTSAPGATNDDPAARWSYPQTRQSEGYEITLHSPQIRNWPDYERFEAWMVLEVKHPDGEQASIGSIVVEGGTTLDLEKRLVHVWHARVKELHFSDPLSDATESAVRHLIAGKPVDVPLDLFLAHVADAVLSEAPPAGFNLEPPPIYVRTQPAIVVIVVGDAVFDSEIAGGLKRVVNANWPIFKDSSDQHLYLLADKTWLRAPTLDAPWEAVATLPPAFSQLPDDEALKDIKAAVPPSAPNDNVPEVIFSAVPAELIVIDGHADLEPIPGAEGLSYVANTESPLFKLDEHWYFLASGRWFAAKNIGRGDWRWIETLPEAFSQIPTDHPMSAVRASVAGTPEARMATLEASLPTRKDVANGAAPDVEVTYTGEPEFMAITNTSVRRAANTAQDIFEYEGLYYLCFQGAWYASESATGPWAVTANVPDAIYRIPPDSPGYHVTYVTVNDRDDSDGQITFNFAPAYTYGMYVGYGVPWYGTGWYYPPYLWGGYYYPYYVAYGHGSWYNPSTGGFGTRSVYYGPYGGYTQTAGYNARTGRYGYVETAWDHDDWYSAGQTYNPRTGIHSETTRHYDRDDKQLHTERTRSRGDHSISTERDVDFNNRTSTTRHETARGGEATVNRSRSDGQVSTSGEFTTAGGRSGTIDGSHSRDGGTTTITGEGGGELTLNRDANADGRKWDASYTPGENSPHPRQNHDNLYATATGQVMRQSDRDWQSYSDGRWQSVNSRDRDLGGRGLDSDSWSTLRRDADARQNAQRSFQSRDAWSRGGFDRSGRGFSRGGRGFGGGFRGRR